MIVARAIMVLSVPVLLASCGPQWRRLELANGSIEIPGSPESFADVLQTPSGPVSLQGHSFVAGRWQPGWIAIYAVAHSDVIGVIEPERVDELLRAERARLVEASGVTPRGQQKETLQSERTVEVDGHPGLALVVRTPNGRRAQARICVARGRLYSLYASDTDERVERFFGSFEVL
jgi:hypothetical protein